MLGLGLLGLHCPQRHGALLARGRDARHGDRAEGIAHLLAAIAMLNEARRLDLPHVLLHAQPSPPARDDRARDHRQLHHQPVAEGALDGDGGDVRAVPAQVGGQVDDEVGVRLAAVQQHLEGSPPPRRVGLRAALGALPLATDSGPGQVPRHLQRLRPVDAAGGLAQDGLLRLT